MPISFPFNPFEGMGDLGLGQPQANGQAVTQGQVAPSRGEAAAADWLAKRKAAIAATKEPAPADQGPGGAVLSSLIAAILTGATGAGVQASAPAAQTALQFGGQQIDAANAAAQKEHVDRIKQAADAVASFDDLTKGARMLLQAQPKLFQGEDMKLISAIAFPETGITMADQAKGSLDPATNNMLDAIEFALKSNDIKDSNELARLHNMAFALRTGKANLFGKDAFLDPEYGLNTTMLAKDFINGAEYVAEYQRTGRIPDVSKLEPRATIGTETIPKARLEALRAWAKLQVDQGLSETEALKTLESDHPDMAALLKSWDSERVGGLPDLSTVGRIALSTYLRQGETGQVMGGGLGNIEYFNQTLQARIDAEREDRMTADAKIIKADIDATFERNVKEGMDPDDALESANESVMKKAMHRGRLRNIDPVILKKIGIGE